MNPIPDHRAPAHVRSCMYGHRYNTADTSTHYTTRKGNPRYVCPVCRQDPGFKLPVGWKPVRENEHQAC